MYIIWPKVYGHQTITPICSSSPNSCHKAESIELSGQHLVHKKYLGPTWVVCPEPWPQPHWMPIAPQTFSSDSCLTSLIVLWLMTCTKPHSHVSTSNRKPSQKSEGYYNSNGELNLERIVQHTHVGVVGQVSILLVVQA